MGHAAGGGGDSTLLWEGICRNTGVRWEEVFPLGAGLIPESTVSSPTSQGRAECVCFSFSRLNASRRPW